MTYFGHLIEKPPLPGDDMVTVILFTAKFSAKEGNHIVGLSELFSAEFSAKQGDNIETFIYLPLNFQPREGFTL